MAQDFIPHLLITGASMGIGADLAREFAKQPVRLTLVARNEEKLRTLCSELSQKKIQATYLVYDLSQPASLTRLCEELKNLETLDGIIFNAGVGLYGSFTSQALDDIRELFEINFFSILQMVQALLPLLKKSPRPRLLLVSSVVAWRSIPGLGTYCASKAALNSFAEALRSELYFDNIGVTVAYPGRTHTQFTQNAKSTGWRPFSTEQHGMPARKVAKRMVKAYWRGKRDEYISISNRLLIWGNFLFPKLIDWALAQYFRRQK